LPQPLIFAIFQGLFIFVNMKTFRITFLFCFLGLSQAIAQQFVPGSSFTINGEQFIVEGLKSPFHGGNIVNHVIYHFNSPIAKLEQPSKVNYPSRDCLDALVNRELYYFEENQADFKRFYDVLREVLPPSRLSNVPENNDSNIGLVFVATPRGQIKEISYYLRLNSPYTQQDIALLDKLLKQRMLFTLPRRHVCEGINHFIFHIRVNGNDIRAIHSKSYYLGTGEYWQKMAEELEFRKTLD
jgi:hypothetical protein